MNSNDNHKKKVFIQILEIFWIDKSVIYLEYKLLWNRMTHGHGKISKDNLKKHNNR